MGNRAWLSSPLHSPPPWTCGRRERLADTLLVRADPFTQGRMAECILASGDCVVAVLMLCNVAPELLPDLDRREYPRVDVASIDDLWFSANEIISSCLRAGRGLGWHPEGEKLAKVRQRTQGNLTSD